MHHHLQKVIIDVFCVSESPRRQGEVAALIRFFWGMELWKVKCKTEYWKIRFLFLPAMLSNAVNFVNQPVSEGCI